MVRFNQLIVTLALLVAFFPCGARAQSYPERPVTMIVPYAPGSATDKMARVVASYLAGKLGQTVTVENRFGDAAATGYQEASTSMPDGYTLLFSDMNSLLVKQAVAKQPPTKKVVPVTGATSPTMLFVAHPSVPARFDTVRDLVNYARGHPGALTVSMGATGQSAHLTSERFIAMARLDVKRSFSSTLPPHIEVLAGQAQFAFEPKTAMVPIVKSGKLRALAILKSTRDPDFPDVPTMDESGYPGLVVWNFTLLLAPVGTPTHVIQKLDAAMRAGVQSPDMKSDLATLSAEPISLPRKELGRVIKDEGARWGGLSTAVESTE
jgi:tripartite-type tricarboxylate transporter receptor subunit TctC